MDKKVVKKTIIKKKPMKHKILFRSISTFMLVTTIIFFVFLVKMDVLGLKYSIIAILGVTVIEILLLMIMNKRFKVIVKVPFAIFAVILSLVFCFGIYNVNLALTVVHKIVSSVTKEEKYGVYVLNDSDYEKVEDLSKTKLGIFDNNSDSLEEAVRMLMKHATFKEETNYEDIEELLNAGIDEEIDAFFISNSMIQIIEEEYPDLMSRFKSIGEYTISTEENIKKSDVDVTKDPFLIYISGIDTYGSIGTVSRSDVNILVAVNTKTNKILLVNTPRDYYVKLNSKKAYDKLTHAGLYGVEESMKTLADLYVTDVDFYVKVNFSSLVKIVDTIGGITVNSKYNFSYDGFTFRKGQNKLNGNATLAFSRCRKELPNGDISRGENQEAVIEAMIEKITSTAIISKYTSVLDTLSKSFVTNMSEEDIFSLAKMQLNKTPKWEIESQNATGTNASRTTYSAGKSKLYVMDPDEASVTDVKLKLNEILEED